jgi:serine/threonine-protein kinase
MDLLTGGPRGPVDGMVDIKSFDASSVVGMTLGSAVVLDELARGNMGVVFTAFQQSLKRRIAFKILPKCMYTEESIRLFQQEAEAAAGLSHPGIVPIYEIGETAEFRWFTMQLIEGESLAQMLQRTARNVVPSRRILPLSQALALLRRVLEALDYAHRQGVVHRDIKPENILIPQGTWLPVITDFGIARVTTSGSDALQIPRGSPLYMAPEQILHPDADERVDVHAAGVLLFRLLVEQLPLVAYPSVRDLLKAKLDDRPIFLKRPSEANPRLNPEMDTLIADATAHDPGRRFGSCRDFLKALGPCERKLLGTN